MLRHLRRFVDANDEKIIETPVTLTEVQFALVNDYGFRSWPDMSTLLKNTIREFVDCSGAMLIGPCGK